MPCPGSVCLCHLQECRAGQAQLAGPSTLPPAAPLLPVPLGTRSRGRVTQEAASSQILLWQQQVSPCLCEAFGTSHAHSRFSYPVPDLPVVADVVRAEPEKRDWNHQEKQHCWWWTGRRTLSRPSPGSFMHLWSWLIPNWACSWVLGYYSSREPSAVTRPVCPGCPGTRSAPGQRSWWGSTWCCMLHVELRHPPWCGHNPTCAAMLIRKQQGRGVSRRQLMTRCLAHSQAVLHNQQGSQEQPALQPRVCSCQFN